MYWNRLTATRDLALGPDLGAAEPELSHYVRRNESPSVIRWVMAVTKMPCLWNGNAAAPVIRCSSYWDVMPYIMDCRNRDIALRIE